MIKVIPPIRGADKWGSGEYGASRRTGNFKRRHNGIDIACYKGTKILFPLHEGICTKIGYPYSPEDNKKGHLRYVQIEVSLKYTKYSLRFFYLDPQVETGYTVSRGEIIGITQGLADIYEGITDHFHFEIVKEGKNKKYIDPESLIHL